MTRGRFGEILEAAIAELPEVLRDSLGGVVFVVGDQPRADDPMATGLDPRRETLEGYE